MNPLALNIAKEKLSTPTLAALAAAGVGAVRSVERLCTGFFAIDELAPGGGFATGAIHEVLSDTGTPSFVLPILIARAAAKEGLVVWCDQDRTFYPPAAAVLGLRLDRLLVLHPANEKEGLWAVTEALRCKGVDACIAPLGSLTFLQARRLALAAERGGGVGVLLRPWAVRKRPYAAASRWRVRPMRGEKTIQREWVELICGHGGRVGQGVLLEVCRETDHVRATKAVADRAAETKREAASA